MGNNPNYVPVTAANSPKINVGNSAATGYKTESLLTNIIKTEGAKYAKKEATKFVSNKASQLINDKLGKIGLPGGLGGAAQNAALAGARSASDQLSGVIGGKLSSVLGSGIGGNVASMATKQISNLATGAVTKATSMVKDKLGSAVSGALGGLGGGLLGSALSKLSDTGAKNLLAAKIAPGFLETGPKDESLTQDVYGVSDNSILNGLGEKVTGLAKDAFNDIRKSPGLITDLTSMITSGGANFKISKEGLADRVLGSLGGRTGVLNNLADTFKDTVVGGLGLPADIYSTAIAVIGNKTQKFDAGQMDSARQVFSLINQVTNSSQLKAFFDVGSESALLSGVMREAIALGVPDAIDVLVENAKDSDIAFNALYANMRVACEHSDLDTVNLMIEKVGVTQFLAQVPDAAPVLLSSYELPLGTNSTNYDNEWNALKLALDSLSPNWDKIERNGTMVTDLTAFTGVSDDARKLMMRQPEYLVATLIGSNYAESVDLIADLQQKYPLAPIQSA